MTGTMADNSRPRAVAAHIVLGTAQFGMRYGATSQRRVPESEVMDIMADAAASGVDLVDTAPGYGEGEVVVGRCLSAFPAIGIVTKTPAVAGDTVTVADVENWRRSLLRSLERLQRPRVEALLVHHAPDMMKPGGERLAGVLRDLKAEGLVGRIGASLYDLSGIDRLREILELEIIQVPFNIFDQRLFAGGQMARLRSAGIEVHVRSIFLQGVLLAPAGTLNQYFTRFASQLARYREFLAGQSLPPLQACLGFVARHRDVDRIVVGVAHRGEFGDIAETLGLMPDILPDMTHLASDEAGLIDPRTWPAFHQAIDAVGRA